MEGHTPVKAGAVQSPSLRMDEAVQMTLPEPMIAAGRNAAPTVPHLAVIVTVSVSPMVMFERLETVGEGAVGGVGGVLAVVSW